MMQPGAASAASARVAQAEQVAPDAHACSTDCHARIGIVAAFGAEADILLAQTEARRVRVIHGIRFTTGTLRGHPVVIVLSGVSMINATMTTQLLLDHFPIQRLIMSGIAGGVDPANHVGDVIVPERWMMPMEVYWNADGAVPMPCGKAGEIGCLGLKLATRDGQVLAPYTLPTPQGALATGLFMRQTQVTRTGAAAGGEFLFDYLADPDMLAVARTLTPALLRCARAKPELCVSSQPILKVGGRAASGSAFLANADYRRYLFDTLQV
ncbi:MAG: 5'-methylthioadenosine/S-adenosylhomocysteine nucleosidase, partial [Pseudomonadota bacterium]|nr:5'-methylthioadenosine/S-adenosylhomocysteine nucleosidase [Pseudomonadota bacterium]